MIMQLGLVFILEKFLDLDPHCHTWMTIIHEKLEESI